MSKHRPFTPTPGYRLFLQSLVQTRLDRGYSTQHLAELVGLTPAQVASFEAGEHPLGFIDVRKWLLALDMPFTQFTQQMEEVLDSTLERDESIIFPGGDLEPEPNSYARADPLPHQLPSIQALFFAPGGPPEIRTIANTLEAKQALVEGLITTFETGVSNTIGVANDEALLCDMPLNRHVPATGAHIFGPFFVAGDAPPSFRSLAPLELERLLDALCPELPQTDFPRLISQLEGGQEWMDLWN